MIFYIPTGKYLHIINEGDYSHPGLNICKVSTGSIIFKFKIFNKKFYFWIR